MTYLVAVRYFDGKTSHAHHAHIRQNANGGGFVLMCDGHTKIYAFKVCEFLPSVGKSHAVIEMPNGERIEFIEGVPDWVDFKHKRVFDKISIMESRLSWVAVSLVAVMIFMAIVLKIAIPFASHHIAQNLPDDVLMTVGDKAESNIIAMTADSQLPQTRQDEIVALYRKLNGTPNARIIVRQGNIIGANALAIPNNTIIITDELINLSGNDNEILAVLAHEQGHLVHRHSLEQAISNLGIGVLIVVITGDMSDAMLALPALLTNAHYSQKAELEADKFAIDELKRLGISPKYLADFFEKMQKEQGDQSHWSLLSTHPDTNKRIEQVIKHTP